jgi:hypothetical protein
MARNVRMSDDEFNVFFEAVLNYVKSGDNVETACEIAGINRSRFYRYLSPIQKAELQHAKAIHTQYGVGSISTNRK